MTPRIYRLSTWVPIVAIVALVALVASCNAASSRGPQPPPGQGQLAVYLVDAPNPQVDQIVVNVTRVTAHSTSAGWVTVSPAGINAASPLVVDLLTLQAPATALALGLVDLPPGMVTQVRLFVTQDGNYVVTSGNTVHVPLTVPSGTQTGIKIQGPWGVNACSQTSITLDFDGHRSIWYHPTGVDAGWILRPVIHTRHSGTTPIGCGPSCDLQHPCPEGETCTSDGVCVAVTPPGAVGAPCEGPNDCLTRTCSTSGLCAPGGANSPCQAGSDCVSTVCDDGSCTAPPSPVPAGGPCTMSSDCITNSCVGGVCQPGGQGSTCGATADCQEGMSCVAGACAAP